jgi:hypothetical protein
MASMNDSSAFSDGASITTVNSMSRTLSLVSLFTTLVTASFAAGVAIMLRIFAAVTRVSALLFSRS